LFFKKILVLLLVFALEGVFSSILSLEKRRFI
jgi:hypothetical protein